MAATERDDRRPDRRGPVGDAGLDVEQRLVSCCDHRDALARIDRPSGAPFSHGRRPDGGPGRRSRAPRAARELLGHDDAAVLTAGAADPDRQVRLALLLERGEQQREEPVELFEEEAGLGLREHVLAHGLVDARERTQRFDPVRVRQEAAVEHEVDVEREAVLVAERHDARLQPDARGVVGEARTQPFAQLVDVDVRRVDDDVGFAPQLLEQLALVRDAVAHAIGRGERMAAAARFVAAHEHFVRRVEEQDAHARAHRRELGARGAQLGEEVARAHVDDEAVADRSLAIERELRDLRDERGRHVVDHEEAEVFEDVRGLRPARARHAGDDRDVEGFLVLLITRSHRSSTVDRLRSWSRLARADGRRSPGRRRRGAR